MPVWVLTGSSRLSPLSLPIASRQAAAQPGEGDEEAAAAMMMDVKQIYLVYIVVLRGQTRDTSDERHAGLLFAPLENGAYYYFHLADGSDGAYVFEMKKGFDPRTSRGALPSVRVGKMQPTTAESLAEVMQSAPIKPKEEEFSDQHWVDGALNGLVDAGLINQQACERGFNKMLQTLIDGSADEVPDLDW